ncbi:MAG: 30S ribosomal protein S16 [bacterium]|nr:30S ribosomal protein S16 [bacterium]
MAVKIRLRRMGTRNRPFFRVVAAESTMPLGGKFIEELGHYNPLTNPAEIKLNVERINYWISVGAKPSDTIKNLLLKGKK